MKKIVIALTCLLSSYAFANPEWVNGEIVRIDPSRDRIVRRLVVTDDVQY